MTSDQANALLQLWQLQRRLGIKPEDRLLPGDTDRQDNISIEALDRQLNAVAETALGV